MRSAFDQLERLQPIQDPHESNRFDPKKVREGTLLNAFIPGQVRQNLPLRAGQAQTGATSTLLEVLAQKSRYVMQEKAEGWVETRHGLLPNYRCP
jgi:hypothetical protein